MWVGPVDDGDLDGVQADQLLAHQVLEGPGQADDDVDAGLQRTDLPACGTPPKMVVTFRP